MTYKDVLSDLTNLLDRHKMIQTWGYGNLSDLVTPFKKEDKTGNGTTVYDIDYPYAFLQPLQHSLQKGKVTYNFNLIMMEQCKNEPNAVIQAQSNCQQYIQDVLAEIYYNYDQKYDFTLNSSLTPFKEKYDDTVSGMTANISIEIPMILNDCVAPFLPNYDQLRVSVGKADSQVIGADSGEDQVVAATEIFIDDQVYGDWNVNRFDITKTATWRILLSGYIRIVPGDTDPAPQPLNILKQAGGVAKWTAPTKVTNWPTQPSNGTFEYFELEWTGIELELAWILAYVYFNDEVQPVTADLELEKIQIKMWTE